MPVGALFRGPPRCGQRSGSATQQQHWSMLGLFDLLKETAAVGLLPTKGDWSQLLWWRTNVFKQHIRLRLDLMVDYIKQVGASCNCGFEARFEVSDCSLMPPVETRSLHWQNKGWVNPASPQLYQGSIRSMKMDLSVPIKNPSPTQLTWFLFGFMFWIKQNT